MAFWDLGASALLGAGLQLFSARSAEKGQREANELSANSAKSQMEFQERMSSTAHQREVADLRAAGLNPILSANGGASTPGGAMGSFQSPTASSSDIIARSPERVSNSARSLADLQLTRQLAKTEITKQKYNEAQTEATKGTIQVGPLKTTTEQVKNVAGKVANSAKDFYNKNSGRPFFRLIRDSRKG